MWMDPPCIDLVISRVIMGIIMFFCGNFSISDDWGCPTGNCHEESFTTTWGRGGKSWSPGSFNIRELLQNSPAVQQVQDLQCPDSVLWGALESLEVGASRQPLFLRFLNSPLSSGLQLSSFEDAAVQQFRVYPALGKSMEN